MNILILTGRFGMGHYSASISLKQEIEMTIKDTNIEIIDIFEYAAPKLSKLVYSSFNLLVSKANRLYNFVYKNTSDFDATVPFTDFFVDKIAKLAKDKNTNMFVSTLPLCSRIVSEYKERTGSSIPLVTCITDITTHNEWISSHTDLYLVAADTVKNNLVENGINPERIVISGIPVKEQFKNSMNFRNNIVRSKNILIMGGGLGLIPLEDSFYETISKTQNVKATVIMGNNKKAFDELHGKYENIEVIGFTDKVYEYMAAADLILSKAGGITLFESIYSQLPMLVVCPFLEQEKNNALFIEQKGLGEIIWDKYENIAQRVLSIIRDENKLKEMKRNLYRLKASLNTSAIADAVDKVQLYNVA